MFLAMTSRRGIEAVSSMSPVQPTISFLVKQSKKDQKSGDYAAKCLEFLVKAAPIELYSNESEQ